MRKISLLEKIRAPSRITFCEGLGWGDVSRYFERRDTLDYPSSGLPEVEGIQLLARDTGAIGNDRDGLTSGVGFPGNTRR